jgi:hypothetical protein
MAKRNGKAKHNGKANHVSDDLITLGLAGWKRQMIALEKRIDKRRVMEDRRVVQQTKRAIRSLEAILKVR